MKNRELEDEKIIDDEIDNHLEDRMVNRLNYELDDLQKEKIDTKRRKRIDQTKKRAAVDSVLDERTAFQINKLLTYGTLKKIEGIISAGKEANVYLAYGQTDKEVAIKIYKIDRNTSRWMRNYISGDPRFKKVPHNISKIINLWASKEYKNLKRAYKAGLRVPQPLNIKDNILIMEYIGFGVTPAPRLKDIKKIGNLEYVFEEIKNFIKVLYQKAKLVHGDLSEFNILYHNQKPVVIDISQAVSIEHPKAEVYLARDIKNVFNFFGKKNIDITLDPEQFYYNVINLD
ncbi:MAG: serine protein kinase RIO [Candidatus Lokiarchaeota archaeon]|nr:serine protein kinase RIO [Candidatus Lokiarchaeota archaeon]